MKRTLPPLNSLKAFEASARHKSFTKAADELCVTQGAISKQVRLLEDFLGKSLFERSNNNVFLTDDGKIYLSNISHSLDIITEATEMLSDKKVDNALIINVLPILIDSLITPQLQRFKTMMPLYNLHLLTGDRLFFDYKSEHSDIIIRANNKPFENLINHPIQDEKMLLVCSPSLINQKEFQLKDLQHHTFIENTWRRFILGEWMRKHKLDSKPKNIISVEHFSNMVKFAVTGIGFTFVPSFLVTEEIENGTLINPCNISYKTGFTYYFSYPYRNRKNPAVLAFKECVFGG